MKRILLSVALVLVALMSVIAVSCSNENADHDEDVEVISNADNNGIENSDAVKEENKKDNKKTGEYSNDGMSESNMVDKLFGHLDKSKVGKTYLSGDYEYTVQDDGSAYITGYIGNADTLVVPRKLDEYPISGIGQSAFAEALNLREVTVPGCIKKIEGYAFNKSEYDDYYYGYRSNTKYNESPLKSVVLEDGVEIVEDRAFPQTLTELTVPDSVYRISYKNFSAPFVEKSDNVYYIGKVVIGYDTDKNDGVISIKDGTISICCFANETLSSVIIPNSVSYIDKGVDGYFYASKIYGSEGSYAEKYAKERNIKFVIIDK